MLFNPYDIASIYHDMELDLAESMKRNLKHHYHEEIKEGFEWEQWQKGKLRNIKSFQSRNKKIISQYQKVIDGQTENLLSKSYKGSLNNSDNFFKRVLKNAKSKVRKLLRPQEDNFFKSSEDKVFNLIHAVKGDLHKANHAALRKMDDVYRQTIFKAQMYQVNGAMTVQQAVDMATKDFLKGGLNCVKYKNGRNVNISSYAEMSIRTANQRVTLMGEGAKRDEFGIHTVLAPSHGNTCPKCLEWQGRVLIDDVYSSGTSDEGDYPLLSTAMAAGFLHPSCRHHPTTFIPGVNTVPEPLNEEQRQEALNKYNAEQKQRGIERDIRKWKRIEAGSTDDYNSTIASANVSKYQNQMKKHLEIHDYLRQNNWRERLTED